MKIDLTTCADLRAALMPCAQETLLHVRINGKPVGACEHSVGGGQVFLDITIAKPRRAKK